MYISSLNCAKTMSPPTKGGGGLGQCPVFAAAAIALAAARRHWRKRDGSIAASAAEMMTTTKTKAPALLVAAVAVRWQQKCGSGGSNGSGNVVSLVVAVLLAWWRQQSYQQRCSCRGSLLTATVVAVRRWQEALQLGSSGRQRSSNDGDSTATAFCSGSAIARWQQQRR